MRGFRPLPGERRNSYSAVCVRLIDEMTEQPPIGRVEATLELETAPGQFAPTRIRAVRTMSGLIVYPNLGRSAGVAEPARNYRVTLTAEYYRMLDPPVTFSAPPFNDTNPPSPINKTIRTVLLAPAANYPFPPFLRVLRGRVVEQTTKEGIPGAKVSELNRERVLASDTGEYALPLRWPPLSGQINLDAADLRNGRVVSVTVNLPAALKKGVTIEIP